MQNVTKIILIFVFILMISPFSSAKCHSDNNASVQLLKTLTEEGKAIRENDVPVTKVYVEEDTSRARAKKIKFYEYAFAGNKKIPDNK